MYSHITYLHSAIIYVYRHLYIIYLVVVVVNSNTVFKLAAYLPYRATNK